MSDKTIRYKRPAGILLMPNAEGEFVLYEQYKSTRAQLEVAVGALNRISAGQMETWENIVSKEALAKINEMRGE